MLPYHGCRARPGEFEDPPTYYEIQVDRKTGLSGAAFAEWFLVDKVLGGDRSFEDTLFGYDGESDNFLALGVFCALPFWAAALFFARPGRRRTRWVAGALFWLVLGTLFVAGATEGFEEVPDLSDPPWFGDATRTVCLGIAGGILLLRPRHRWDIRDVEAMVSSQALLGLAICLTYPVTQAWRWTVTDGHTVIATARALWINYRVGFWLALAALALIAAPLYFSEESMRGLYDRCHPWRPRSSTPTPTSTSTGSTPTGTPSSNGPAGPGSSPS